MTDDELIDAMIIAYWEPEQVSRDAMRAVLALVRAHDGDGGRLECGHPAACEQSLSGTQADGAEGCADWCGWCAELAAARAERDRWKQTTRDAIHQGGDLLGRAERAEAEAARLRQDALHLCSALDSICATLYRLAKELDQPAIAKLADVSSTLVVRMQDELRREQAAAMAQEGGR